MPPKRMAVVDLQRNDIAVAVELDGKGKVKRVSPSSIFLGILYADDVILTVGNKAVQTTADFLNATRALVPGKITVIYEREENYIATVKKLTPERPNTEMIEVEMIWKSTGRAGFLIHKDFENRVIISVVEDGGPASKYVKAGDYVIKVNDVKVADRDAARDAILKAVTDRKLKLVLERAVAQKSLMITPSVIVEPSKADGPPIPAAAIVIPANAGPRSVMASVLMPPNFTAAAPSPVAEDVLKVLKEKENFYKEKPSTPGIIVKAAAASSPAMMAPDKPVEQPIDYDPSPKNLKPTPKRVGS